MNSTPKTLQWIVWGGLSVTICAIAAAFFVGNRGRENKADDYFPTPGHKALPVIFSVPGFALTNQAGQTITRETLLGHVWIANIVFTRCAGPCPEMTRRMGELQTALPPSAPVRFVTLTANPEFDTPSVLQAYARRHAADVQRWHFLTGTKRQIVDLAIDGLKFTTLEKEEAQRENLNDLFIHSTTFVIIDRRGRARGVLENDDDATKLKALSIVQQLIDER